MRRNSQADVAFLHCRYVLRSSDVGKERMGEAVCSRSENLHRDYLTDLRCAQVSSLHTALTPSQLSLPTVRPPLPHTECDQAHRDHGIEFDLIEDLLTCSAHSR